MDDSGIGRVSNVGRYAVLHLVASDVLAELQAGYLVLRESGLNLDPDLVTSASAVRVDRLLPEDRHAAPVTIAVTDFPGVLVRFGRWHVEAFPRCGCDYCDEAPEALASSLVDKLNAVALGGFSESKRNHEFVLSNGARESGSSSGFNRPTPAGDKLRTPPRSAWKPWASRAVDS